MLLEPVLPVNAMLVSVFTLAVVNHGKAVLTIFFYRMFGLWWRVAFVFP